MIVFILFGLLFFVALIFKVVVNISFKNDSSKKDVAYPIVPGDINSDIPLGKALKNFRKMGQ